MGEHVSRTLALSGSTARPRAWLAMLAFVLPVALVGISLFLSLRAEPALAGPASLLMLALVATSSALLWWWLDRRVRRVGVALGEDRLRIDCGFGRGDFALTQLAAQGLRVIELGDDVAYRPRVRTWGIGLPGLSSGWYRLRNGDKALCILTDRRKPCMLRTPDGTRILLSLADPSPLRKALERSLRL